MTEINQTTTYVADQADVQYEVNVELKTPGMAIDASAPVTGRSFIINGTLSARSGTAILLGNASLADSQTYVKIGDVGTFTSSGKGLVAASGGVTFENVGVFSAVSTAVQFKGDNNVFKNVSTKDEEDDVKGPGTLTSSEGSALITAGRNDIIDNTGAGIISARLDAIVSTGNKISISNNGTATITSTAGSAIVTSGNGDKITSNSSITAFIDAIVAKGANAVITNSGDSSITSSNGRGIVSTGTGARIINDATVSAKSDGIFSSGDNARIDNTAAITSKTGAAIRSTGNDVVITNSTTLVGKGAGILSSGDHATITNFFEITARSIGIKIAGDDAVVTTQSHVTAGIAIMVSGDGAVITNENQITGTSGQAATIEITATGKTTITNTSAISTGSGTVINAGNGAETVDNSGSLYGVVNLGGGNDYFKSTGEVTGSVNTGKGNDIVINTGDLQFDVDLGAGNDVFTSMKGNVGGKVYGGAGDDRYVIGIDLDIVEKAGGGVDIVQSKFTYTLAANIEDLELLGKGRMEATGNNLANRITGNAGNNHLTGLGGKDVFVFETGSRQDIVTDFTDGRDRIDLSGYQGIDNFADLRTGIAQSGDDVTINFDGHDRLTLENVHKADLSAADFLF